MKLYLTKINGTLFNDENIILLTNTIKEKIDIINDLFKEPSIDTEPIKSSVPNNLTVVLNGVIKNYNYAKIVDDIEKFYYIQSTEILYQGKNTKTRLKLKYDEINNSDLNTNMLIENSKNNNCLLFRSSSEYEKPTFEQLSKCSEICKNIDTQIDIIKDTPIKINSYSNETNKDLVPILYIKFSNFKGPQQTRPFDLLRKFLSSIIISDIYKEITKDAPINQNWTYINGEYTSYIPIIFPLEIHFPDILIWAKKINVIFRGMTKVEVPEEWIGDIKVDFIHINALKEFIAKKVVIPVYASLASGNGNYIACYIFKTFETTMDEVYTTSRVPFFPKISNVINDYEYTHLNYVHRQPNFYSQKWKNTKEFSPFIESYDFLQIIGIDNTFIQPFGKNNEISEFASNDEINNNLSTTINVSPFISRLDQNTNSAIYGLTTSIIQALGIYGGAKLSHGAPTPTDSMATMLGITSGVQGFQGITRGLVYSGLAVKNRMRGGTTTNMSEKKYINNFETEDVYRRQSIHIIENYLTQEQIKKIETDRKVYGNYINEIKELTLNKKNKTYIECEFIDFSYENGNINLKNEIKRKFNKGVFINHIESFGELELNFTSDETIITTPAKNILKEKTIIKFMNK